MTSIPIGDQSLVERLRIRAEIRRQIPSRKSVQEGKPDRIADLLEEAAARIIELEKELAEEKATVASMLSREADWEDDILQRKDPE